MVKVTMNTNPDSTIPFPRLMHSRDTGIIVFYSNPLHGVVLSGGRSDCKVGSIMDSMYSLEVFNGSITLQNG